MEGMTENGERMLSRGGKLSLGLSPCPNDTFIFHALLHGQVTDPSAWAPVMADVEELNRMVLAGELDVSKVSYHVLGYVLRDYVVLRAGSALGRGCGPLLVSQKPMSLLELEGTPVAIPGLHTTAALLLRFFLPRATELVPMLFSRIPEAVANGDVVAGVIIHESRFTYQELGITCLQDLGAWWEQETGNPIPLGGIVARRSLGPERLAAINSVLAASVQYARAHPTASQAFVRQHAQEMDEEVITRHIGLYVTEYTEDLGAEGALAVEDLLRLGWQRGVFPSSLPNGLEIVFSKRPHERR